MGSVSALYAHALEDKGMVVVCDTGNFDILLQMEI